MKRVFQTTDDQFGVNYLDQSISYGKPNRSGKSLCVSNIAAHYADDVLVNELQSTFQQFGELQVKIAGYMGQRVAYLNFFQEKSANDAYDRYLSKNLALFDRNVHIEPVRGGGKTRGPRDNFDKSNERFNSKSLMLGPRRDNVDSKQRYAHHLDRTPPEDDPNATRTLFVGNLDPAITKEDITKAFGTYGVLLDVDIKYSGNSAGRGPQNPVCFAFLKFKTVDEAFAAKLGMSGQMLASHTCKIGYGKIVPSICLWVGNFPSEVNGDILERSFARFGQINRFKLERNSNGDRFALVLFDSNDSASNAASKMRSYRFPKTNRRLRVDYIPPDEFDQYEGYEDPDIGKEQDSNIHSEIITQAKSLTEVFPQLNQIWSGQLMVKSSLFLSELYVFAGDGELITSHLAAGAQMVKISQRIALTDSHIEELQKRCRLARSGYCVILASPNKDSAYQNKIKKNPSMNQLFIRPLRALSQYLRDKNIMGVFTLQNSPFPTSVTLCYVISHCNFTEKMLLKYCPNLNFEEENSKDDYLMLICFRSPLLHA